MRSRRWLASAMASSKGPLISAGKGVGDSPDVNRFKGDAAPAAMPRP